MNYSVVRQFYNHIIDSIYNLYFKIIDFGKILWETFLAFLEIWAIFFSIFFNLFMFFYYLFLFSIDKSLDTNPFPKKGAGRKQYTSQKNFGRDAISTIRGAFSSGVPSSAKSVPAASSFSAAGSARIGRPHSGAKTSIIKEILKSISGLITGFFRAIKNFLKNLAGGMPDMSKATKKEQEYTQKKGLIDEYLKEYEQSRKV
jgi:hypothetical protein